MSTRTKVLSLLTLLVTASIAGIRWVHQRTILPDYERLEVDLTGRQLSRVVDAIQGELDRLTTHCGQFVLRDEVDRALIDADAAPLRSALLDELFLDGHIDFACLVQGDATPVLTEARAPDESRAAIEVEEFSPDSWSPLHPYFVRYETVSVVTDLRTTSRGPILLSTRLVGRDGVGAPRGWLVLGRFLSPNVHHRLLQQTLVAFRFWDASSLDLPSRERAALARLQTGEVSVSEPRSQSVRYSYGLLNNAYGGPSLLLRVDSARDVSARGIDLTQDVTLASAGILVVIALLLYVALDRVLLRRVERELGKATSGRRDGVCALHSSGDRALLDDVGAAVHDVYGDLELLASTIRRGALSELPSVWKRFGEAEVDGRDGKLAEWLRSVQAEWTLMCRRSKGVQDGLRSVLEITRLHQDLRQEGSSPELVCIETLLDEAITATAEVECAFPLEIVRELDPMPKVPADRVELGQVLEVLIRHARESVAAGPPGDHVIALRLGRLDEEWVRIEVADTGGRDDQRYGELFRPDAGTSSRRSLYVAAARVGEMGGSLTAERTDRGLALVVELPIGGVIDYAAEAEAAVGPRDASGVSKS